MGALASTLTRLMLIVALAVGAAAPAHAQSRTFIRDAEIERTLRRLSDPIFQAAGLDPASIDIFLLQDTTLNAFVTGGRTMVLYSGLLQRFPQAETLIGVIAHETGHISGGHVTRRAAMARDLRGPALMAMILGTAAAAAAGGGQAAAAAALGSQSAIQRVISAYTRAEEAAADQAAVGYMTRANIDPEGMLAILRLFKGQEVFRSDRVDPYLLSHPLSSERISLLEDRIARSPARGAPLDPQLAYWHERMRAKLDGFIERPERVLARIRESAEPESEFNLYRRAIAEFRGANPDTALQTLDRLLRQRPDDPFYWELRGQILFESARPAEAIDPLRRAVALAPNEPLIAGMLGRALLAAGGPQAEAEALATLQRAARDDPGEAMILRDLAQAYARAGDDGMAALTTAERMALTGNPQDAAMMARRALQVLPQGSPAWMRADDLAALADG
jgi:predicted Zn-dependent protease